MKHMNYHDPVININRINKFGMAARHSPISPSLSQSLFNLENVQRADN